MDYTPIDNAKEIYLLNKESYKNIFDEYEKANDKVHKIIPTITVIISVTAYIINWMLTFYKNCNKIQGGLLIIMGIICLNIVLYIYEIVKNISLALRIQNMMIVKSNIEHSNYYRNESLNIMYKDFIEEYVNANETNYIILKEKIVYVRNFYEKLIDLIKAISVLLLFYIITNII